MDHEKARTTSTATQHRDYVHGLILRMASAANVELTEDSQAVYLEQLVTLKPEAIQQAAQRTVREWDRPNMMPPIAFILKRAGQDPELEAEKAWEWINGYIRHHWHIDIGHFAGAPLIPPATEYAVRQAGGLAKIAYHSDKDSDFIRKGFLQAHQRFESEVGEQTKFSHAEATKFLGSLRVAANSGHLPPDLSIVKREEDTDK